MTQRRVAGKIKGTEDFSALQKGLGIFKVLVIARFSNFFAKVTLFSVAVPTGSVFCRCSLCRNYVLTALDCRVPEWLK